MTDDELTEFFSDILDQSAERGATAALAKVGLDYEEAGKDIRTIRDVLSGYRLFKKGALSTAIGGTGKIVGWSIVFSIAAFLSQHFHFLKPITDRLMEPPVP